jgi:hypothetical protein
VNAVEVVKPPPGRGIVVVEYAVDVATAPGPAGPVVPAATFVEEAAAPDVRPLVLVKVVFA